MANSRITPDNDISPIDSNNQEYEFYTAAEVRDRLRIGKDTFKRLMDEKQIKAFKLNGQWRIEKASFHAYLDSGKRRGSITFFTFEYKDLLNISDSDAANLSDSDFSEYIYQMSIAEHKNETLEEYLKASTEDNNG